MKLRKVLAGAMALVMVAGSVLVAPVNANAAEADTTTGLVGYYSFEDTIDNHVSESGKATVHGGAGATWGAKADATGTYADGKVNKAYSFAGDGDARGDGLWLDVKTSATGAYSLSMWVNTAEKINFQPVAFMAADFWNYVAIGTLYNDSGSAAIVSAANAEIGVAPTVNAVWTFADCFYEGCPATVGDLPLNTWTYVTLTVSADGKMALYHNAELVKEVQMANCDGSITAERFANRDLYLGINFWDRSFKGMMDEVSVYHRALSADDVAALYAANGVPVIPVEGIALDATEKNVVVGDTFTLKATTSPSYVTTDTTVTWTSSNEEVATVDTTGKVTAVAKGDATITATVAGTIKATCTVKVVEEANKITAFDLSADKTEIKIGATAQLTAKITLENNDKEATESTTVTYKSSDEKVATVDKDGKVTAVAIGKATITATVGTFTDTVEITVPAVPATAIDAKADKTELKVGETATITATVTPEDTTDAIAWATSNGDVVTVDNGKVTAVGAGTATVTITAGDIKEEIKFTVTETSKIELGDLTVDGFWTAHTAGVKIESGKTYTITFDAKSTDSTNAWNCPVYVIYTNSAAKVDNASADYKEYLVCRADNWAWTANGDSGAGKLGDGYKFETIAVPEVEDWVAAYKADLADGAKGTITAVLSGKNLIVTYKIAGVESKATIPVDTSKPLYFSLTGEKVAMTDITAVAKTIPAKGDVTSMLPIALVVFGGAVVIVASKKRFA